MTINTSQNCAIDSVTRCIVCPALPASPAKPPSSQLVDGWVSGACSAPERDGDIFVRFSVDVVGAVACGFRTGRSNPANVSLLEHALLVQRSAAGMVASVLERGSVSFSTYQITGDDTDVYEIRRLKGRVMYLINNQFVYLSQNRSGGPKVIGGCLYRTGDKIV